MLDPKHMRSYGMYAGNKILYGGIFLPDGFYIVLFFYIHFFIFFSTKESEKREILSLP